MYSIGGLQDKIPQTWTHAILKQHEVQVTGIKTLIG